MSRTQHSVGCQNSIITGPQRKWHLSQMRCSFRGKPGKDEKDIAGGMGIKQEDRHAGGNGGTGRQ